MKGGYNTYLNEITLLVSGRGECNVAQKWQSIQLRRRNAQRICSSDVAVVRSIADCARRERCGIHKKERFENLFSRGETNGVLVIGIHWKIVKWLENQV